MTPMISSPSSYLDPETNEYGVTRFLSLTNSSDEEPGSSHQLPQYQIPRVTNIRFIAFSNPKNTCEHDPNVPLHDGEWGFVDSAIEKRAADRQDTQPLKSKLDG
ncbi:hypothetical protein DPSP01_011430 [Paraphaeosphaeria sporulosa]